MATTKSSKFLDSGCMTLAQFFSMVVDEFGVKYLGKDNDAQLIKLLKEHYTLDNYWSGAKYVGKTMTWD